MADAESAISSNARPTDIERPVVNGLASILPAPTSFARLFKAG